jgi:hypothetical protein
MATSATQQFVPIERVRDGIITLKNGELRAVLITSSINLALKSADEQQGIILQFQNLLNSIEFPIQIFVQSRRLNIKPYLNLLAEREGVVKEELLKIQIREYINFIDKFTGETNIMTKHFFIVVPYYPSAINTSGGASSLFPFGKKDDVKTQNISFEQGRLQLEQRMDTVIQGLSRFGVRAVKLSSEEVVELFYKLFNPGEDEHPIIPKMDNTN